MIRSSISLLLAVLVCVSCQKGTPTNPILPPGVSPTPLEQPAYVGIGKYQKLATMTVAQSFGGVGFVSFLETRQAPGAIVSQKDQGFVFAYQGTSVISRRDGELRESVEPGKAAWVGSASEHVNGSSADVIWYFVSHRSITRRAEPPPAPSAKYVYTTGDPPPSDKKVTYELGFITMDVNGRTSSHSHGGAEAFYVLNGSVRLALNNGTKTDLSAGQGASIRPGMVMQLHVVGQQPVQILTLFLTPEGAPWQTNLQTLP